MPDRTLSQSFKLLLPDMREMDLVGLLSHIRASPLLCSDHLVTVQESVCPRDGIWIDPQHSRELAYRRKLLAGFQPSHCYLMLESVHDLQVNRHAGLRIDP